MLDLSFDSKQQVVIIGRPNVGKSLLFNRLLGRRQALVHRAPGMTLDFLRERLSLVNGQTAWLVDTGGVVGEEDSWSDMARQRMEYAASRADLMMLVVDASVGKVAGDEILSQWLRRRWKVPWLLVVNKAEGLSTEVACVDFHTLGSDTMLSVSAKQGDGLDNLHETLARLLPSSTDADPDTDRQLPRIAVIGRPNVGKSTFINRVLMTERMLVSSRPGTTRDAVPSEWLHKRGAIQLIDTAGMGRRRAVAEREKMSVAKTRQTLRESDVALLMLDLSMGATYQDRRIAALTVDSGCSVCVIANKADLLPARQRNSHLRQTIADLALGIPVRSFALSATTSRHLPSVGIIDTVLQLAATVHQTISTARINQILEKIVANQSPRQCGLTRPKLRYAHQGGKQPLKIIVHGSAVNRIEESYRRYLESSFVRELSLTGIPVKIVFRAEENPYV